MSNDTFIMWDALYYFNVRRKNECISLFQSKEHQDNIFCCTQKKAWKEEARSALRSKWERVETSAFHLIYLLLEEIFTMLVNILPGLKKSELN